MNICLHQKELLQPMGLRGEALDGLSRRRGVCGSSYPPPDAVLSGGSPEGSSLHASPHNPAEIPEDSTLHDLHTDGTNIRRRTQRCMTKHN